MTVIWNKGIETAPKDREILVLTHDDDLIINCKYDETYKGFIKKTKISIFGFVIAKGYPIQIRDIGHWAEMPELPL